MASAALALGINKLGMGDRGVEAQIKWANFVTVCRCMIRTAIVAFLPLQGSASVLDN